MGKKWYKAILFACLREPEQIKYLVCRNYGEYKFKALQKFSFIMTNYYYAIRIFVEFNLYLFMFWIRNQVFEVQLAQICTTQHSLIILMCTFE